MKKVGICCAAAGFLISVSLLSFSRATGYIFGETAFRLWPSSLMLMATETMTSGIMIWAVVALSIVLNALLYAGVGLLLWCGFRVVKRVISS